MVSEKEEGIGVEVEEWRWRRVALMGLMEGRWWFMRAHDDTDDFLERTNIILEEEFNV